MRHRRLVSIYRLTLLGVMVFPVAPVRASQPKAIRSTLDARAFFRPELAISASHVALEEVLSALPNQASWRRFLERQAASTRGYEPGLRVFVDPRSGAASNIVGAFPLVPGRGLGNRVTLGQLAARLGVSVRALDPSVVGAAFTRFVTEHRDVLGIDVAELGEVRATAVTPEIWQIHGPQVVKGIAVRHARLLGTINNGNLVVVGAEAWGPVRLDTKPRLTGEEALAAGFAFAEGRISSDGIVSGPALEIVPIAPRETQSVEEFVGAVGSGYGHRLVWTFTFRRPPEEARWEVLVDAQGGEILSFQDVNQYAGKIKGGVYPVTSTEQCPDAARCGTLQPGTPMPFADTGRPAPNDFANSAGVVAADGALTTTLSGRYVNVNDNCGSTNESSTSGTLDLGGTNGQHDCASGGSSAGNTASARSAFYELNRIAEVARGWLPGNAWLRSSLPTSVNIDDVCNAFWNPPAGSVNFFKSGGGCRNTGEIAAVFDHEWGHGLDDNDANGSISNSGEGYADIAAIYRLNTSCVGYGFFSSLDQGCGRTADGTGFNVDEGQTGGSHCARDCSGVRDADWAKHADGQPDTALGFVCGQCGAGPGPCGRQVHCAAAPVRQAAWDLVARDLQQAPFGLDAQSALVVGNKLFYQGSGNVGTWHACSCGNSSSGCGATNGYMQWLAADDDNGNLNDGTPHMTAIHAAFSRHGIACANPAPRNGGCAGGPTAAATLTVTAGDGEARLSWTAVAGATRYFSQPVDLSRGEENFLILYGTGIRLREAQSQVSVTVGGEACEVTYASSQPDFTGLDQVNCQLSDALRGRSGTVEIRVRVDSPQAVIKDANVLTLVLR